MTLISKVEITGIMAFSYDGCVKQLIQKGTAKLLDELKNVKPVLIKE